MTTAIVKVIGTQKDGLERLMASYPLLYKGNLKLGNEAEKFEIRSAKEWDIRKDMIILCKWPRCRRMLLMF